jgi:hypothetical protein
MLFFFVEVISVLSEVYLDLTLICIEHLARVQPLHVFWPIEP